MQLKPKFTPAELQELADFRTRMLASPGSLHPVPDLVRKAMARESAPLVTANAGALETIRQQEGFVSPEVGRLRFR